MENINLKRSDNIEVAEYWGGKGVRGVKIDLIKINGILLPLLAGNTASSLMTIYRKLYEELCQVSGEHTCTIEMKTSIASTFQGGFGGT
jgi:hypothetical protein